MKHYSTLSFIFGNLTFLVNCSARGFGSLRTFNGPRIVPDPPPTKFDKASILFSRYWCSYIPKRNALMFHWIFQAFLSRLPSFVNFKRPFTKIAVQWWPEAAWSSKSGVLLHSDIRNPVHHSGTWDFEDEQPSRRGIGNRLHLTRQHYQSHCRRDPVKSSWHTWYWLGIFGRFIRG